MCVLDCHSHSTQELTFMNIYTRSEKGQIFYWSLNCCHVSRFLSVLVRSGGGSILELTLVPRPCPLPTGRGIKVVGRRSARPLVVVPLGDKGGPDGASHASIDPGPVRPAERAPCTIMADHWGRDDNAKRHRRPTAPSSSTLRTIVIWDFFCWSWSFFLQRGDNAPNNLNRLGYF